MRTLNNHLILYDAECPMCQLYTNAFTRSGMLDPNGRAPYQDIPPAACPLVDLQRAVNEIALIDTKTGEVKYGIESLFKVIGHSFPLFRPLFSWRPFLWIMRKVYAFISYNRKVIIPPPAYTPAPATAATPTTKPDTLQPAFRLRYRLAWLVTTVIIAAAILTRYAHLLTGILPPGGPWREYLICTGQILCQGMVVSIIAPAKRWDYLGNMMTISLAGSLALAPVLAIAALTHLPPIAATGWFLIVADLMLLEHIRRTKLLGLDWTLTVSWAAYRLVVLILILL
jgi:hypothetical protein